VKCKILQLDVKHRCLSPTQTVTSAFYLPETKYVFTVWWLQGSWQKRCNDNSKWSL